MSKKNRYTVKRILDRRETKAGVQYLLEWEPNWEWESNLNCRELIKEFLESRPVRNKKTVKRKKSSFSQTFDSDVLETLNTKKSKDNNENDIIRGKYHSCNGNCHLNTSDKSGASQDLEVKKVLGLATDEKENKTVAIEWNDSKKEPEFMLWNEAVEKYPKIIIKFLENNIVFKD